MVQALKAYRNGQGVPRGAWLVFAGHSLGGMVAQNVAADIEIARTWPPHRVITFGSPKTIGGPSWVRIKRFGAYLLTPQKKPHIDFVTTLTPRSDTTKAQIWFDSGVRAEESLGGGIAVADLLALHSSYPKANELSRYDALGDKIESARNAQTLVLDPTSMEYCISPVLK